MDLDKVLVELGQCGRFQITNYILICLPIIFSAMFTLTFVFTAGDVAYRCKVPECDTVDPEYAPECKVPECDTVDPEYAPEWLPHAVPYQENTHGKEVASRCFRFAAKRSNETGGDSCPKSLFSNHTITCKEWVFDPQEASIASEFQLTCGDQWKSTIAGTVNSMGQFVGLPITGIISDRVGRKTALVSALCLTSIMGLCRSLAWNYESFLFFEFLDPMVGGGVYSSSFVLETTLSTPDRDVNLDLLVTGSLVYCDSSALDPTATEAGMELVGPDKRSLGATIISVFYSVGEATLGAIALALRQWRHILRAIYIPALFFISYFWNKPCLASTAIVTIIQTLVDVISLVSRNKPCLASTPIVTIILTLVDVLKLLEEQGKNPEKLSGSVLRRVISSKILLLRFINCCFCWLTNTFVFFGLALNSVSVSGNKYSNFMLVALIELPAYVITYFTMNKFGRRSSLAVSLAASGLYMDHTRLVLFLLGKMAITLSFTVIYVFTAEMFPTPLRHSVISTSCMVGRIGSIVAPQTPLLLANALVVFISTAEDGDIEVRISAEYMESLPLLLFGGMSLLSGALALFFPETLGTKLPDTVEEAENIGKTRRQDVAQAVTAAAAALVSRLRPQQTVTTPDARDIHTGRGVFQDPAVLASRFQDGSKGRNLSLYFEGERK
uniref:Uncharacterized protein n=1 Tax=Timema cristinae TaxID=61476 RepID=A0A7R9CQP9_TIMCR|nr:unnamed protein product [Timema cristinae]